MTEIYIINSETPKDLLLELQQIDPKHQYTLMKSKTAKALLLEIEETEANARLKRELKQKELAYLKEQKTKPWRDFLFKKTFEPNKLTNKQIEDLCYEFYEEFIVPNKRRVKNYPKPPFVNIIEELKWWFPLRDFVSGSRGYKHIVDRYLKSIDNEIGMRNKPILDLPFTDPVSANGTYGDLVNRNNNFGGIVQYGRENYRIYYINFEGQKLSEENQKFWNWFQKSFDVVAMYYDKDTNTCHVIKKPDEWKIEDNNTKMYYRYGNKERYFFRKLEVPKWIYVTTAEELNPKDYLLLDNADVKAEFIKKIGIDKFVELGTAIDSYENYPDNEMWAKSEYKIIDMHEIIPPRKLVDRWGNKQGNSKPYEYAPFLYMKNQTTGAYHLEGIHPRCKTLYDAIKMRYNGLNISNYEIKDIK